MKLWLRSELDQAWRGKDPFDCVRNLRGQVFREKEGRRTLRFEQCERAYFLKLHQGVGWREIIKNLLQLRAPVLGARNEYQAILALQRIGIDTLTPAAFGERGRNPARRLSFLVTDALEGVESLEDLCGRWPQRPPSFAFKRRLIERLGRMTADLHAAGINHRDYYLCHFLIERDPEPCAGDIAARPLYLMDLHRAQLRARIPSRWRVKDLGGLYYSALDIGLSSRDVLRFMRAYTGAPLRDCFAVLSWEAVRHRAGRIYRRDHGRAPDSEAWHLPALCIRH